MKKETAPEFFIDIVSNEIFFDTKNEVKIADVIRSLQALERIGKRTPLALNVLLNSNIHHAEVFIERLESGSLLEKVAIRLFFKDEAGLNAFIDTFREKYALNEGGEVKTIVKAGLATVIIGMAGYGLYQASKSSAPSVQQNIELNNNNIFITGAKEFGVDAELFKLAIVAGAEKRARSHAKDSIDLIAPAKNSGGNVIAGGATLESETVKASPSALPKPSDEIEEPYPDADIQIRATDMDSQLKGWAAVFPGVVDRRVPMEIHPDLDADAVSSSMSKGTLRADIVVVFKKASRGKASELVPARIIVTGLVTE